MGRLLQRSGNATSLPYAFLPGNHEVTKPLPRAARPDQHYPWLQCPSPPYF